MKQQLQNQNTLPQIKKPTFKSLFSSLSAYELSENILLFILSRIFFMDYLFSPFGVAAFGVLFFKKRRPYYIIFSALGAASSASPVFFFKYTGAILIVMSIQLIFSKELADKKQVVSVLGSLSVFLTGILYVFCEGFFFFDFLLLLLECAVLYVAFFVFDKAFFSIKSASVKNAFEPLGFICVISLLACAAFGISITDNFWPLAHIGAIFVILLSGLAYGFGLSTPTGAIFGFALSFSTPYPSQMICIYALSSLLSGLVSQYGRLAASFVFAGSSLITTLLLCPEANGILTVSYVAAACLLLFFVPEKFMETKNTSLQKTRKEVSLAQKVKSATDLKIAQAIDSVESVGTVFGEVIESFRDTKCDTTEQILRATADVVCSDCSLCKYCWSKEKEKTKSICSRMISSMSNNRAVAKKDVPKDFSDMCIRQDAFLAELNKNYESQKVSKMWEGKLYESRRLVLEQFKNITMILKNLKESVAEETDFIPMAESRILSALAHHGIASGGVSVKKSHGYSVTVESLSCDKQIDCDTHTAAIISEALDVPMVKEPTESDGNVCRAVFTQKPRLRADVAVSGATKKNSHLSGDNAAVFSLDAGRVAIVLADGMGSGEMASFESSIVVKLAKKLLSSGFNLSTCIRLINDILMTNSDKDTFSTVDICVINLYNGAAEFAKTGACVSFLRSQNAFDVVNASSLPAGLIHGITPDFDKKILTSGDYLVMASDGVTDALTGDGENGIFKILDGFLGAPEELSDRILNCALKKSAGEALDDMTVIACRINDNEFNNTF